MKSMYILSIKSIFFFHNFLGHEGEHPDRPRKISKTKNVSFQKCKNMCKKTDNCQFYKWRVKVKIILHILLIKYFQRDTKVCWLLGIDFIKVEGGVSGLI